METSNGATDSLEGRRSLCFFEFFDFVDREWFLALAGRVWKRPSFFRSKRKKKSEEDMERFLTKGQRKAPRNALYTWSHGQTRCPLASYRKFAANLWTDRLHFVNRSFVEERNVLNDFIDAQLSHFWRIYCLPRFSASCLHKSEVPLVRWGFLQGDARRYEDTHILHLAIHKIKWIMNIYI